MTSRKSLLGDGNVPRFCLGIGAGHQELREASGRLQLEQYILSCIEVQRFAGGAGEIWDGLIHEDEKWPVRRRGQFAPGVQVGRQGAADLGPACKRGGPEQYAACLRTFEGTLEERWSPSE